MRGFVAKLRIISEYNEFKSPIPKKCRCGKKADYCINTKTLDYGNNIKKYDDEIYLCKECLMDKLEDMAHEIKEDLKEDK